MPFKLLSNIFKLGTNSQNKTPDFRRLARIGGLIDMLNFILVTYESVNVVVFVYT